MHRASSLGLHLSPTTIPVLQKCLQAPGATIGHMLRICARRYSATRLSVHPRQSNFGERLNTESFRSGGVARSATFFPSRSENQLSSNSYQENYLVEEIKMTEDRGRAEEAEAQECAIKMRFSPQDVTGSSSIELVGDDEEQRVAPLPPSAQVQEVPFLSGRPWARMPVKPLRATAENGRGRSARLLIPSLEGVVEDAERILQDMLHVLATTSSAKDGWKAYVVLSRLQQRHGVSTDEATSIIPFAHLHRLARVISQNTPKTRNQFLHLLSVLTTIQNYGGEIQLHEWNALIDHAGKGSRKTRPEDFNNSLSIYFDMIHNRPPGSRFSDAGFDDILNPGSDEDPFSLDVTSTPAVEPDIHTYTTLINIAARTNHSPTLHRATTLLKQAKLLPNRITHLSLLKYFTAKKQLSGIRSTLARMREQNLDIGVDGLNACMWAYSHNNRIDLVMMIYRVLRHNIVPEELDGDDDIDSVQEQLRTDEGIIVAPDLRPNEVTFILLIQTMAYHGNLHAALSVFIDMLSTPNTEQGVPLVLDQDGELQLVVYSPTIHVFRAILLGFSRHGIAPPDNGRKAGFSDEDPDNLEWNLNNLQNIFERFLDLPSNSKISESTIFWTLNAFSRTSGHDVELLQNIWLRMEDRFGSFKRGPDHRLTKWRHKLFPETQEIETIG
ncbi:hypothetical protein AN958_10163 [Leucoagaricus sp. SymC.cos]|nr:hypothetical protein AN958_10163 [Leucoagaricus sp. SymC.cos]